MADEKKTVPVNRMTMLELDPDAGSKLPEWALGLTPRKLRFVQEYLVDFNCRAAAERAQLSQSVASQSSLGKRLLMDDDVREAVSKAMQQTSQERERLRKRILEELSVLAFYDIRDFVEVRSNTVNIRDTDELLDDQARAVKRYKQTTGKSESVEVEMHDKIKALELMAKMNGDMPQPGMKMGDFNQTNVQIGPTVLTEEEAEAVSLPPKKA